MSPPTPIARSLPSPISGHGWWGCPRGVGGRRFAEVGGMSTPACAGATQAFHQLLRFTWSGLGWGVKRMSEAPSSSSVSALPPLAEAGSRGGVGRGRGGVTRSAGPRRERGCAAWDVPSVKNLCLEMKQRCQEPRSWGGWWKRSVCCRGPVGGCVSVWESPLAGGWLRRCPEREDFHLWKMDSLYPGGQSKAFPFSLPLSFQNK